MDGVVRADLGYLCEVVSSPGASTASLKGLKGFKPHAQKESCRNLMKKPVASEIQNRWFLHQVPILSLYSTGNAFCQQPLDACRNLG